MAHVVSAIQYVEGVIRDAAFFCRKSSDITTPSRGGCSSGRSTRDQGPTHAAKSKRSRLFTFNVDVDG